MSAAEPTSTPFPEHATGSVLSAISNEMVRIHKEQFGRGPTTARTNYVGPNTLLSILEDSLSPVERNLCAMGQAGRVREIRLLFQYTEESKFIEAVERHTGRKVRAFVSGIDVENDVSSEVFQLEPMGEDGGSES
jgi:uncharacterized protein YbcI